jgi:hypothetical protein
LHQIDDGGQSLLFEYFLCLVTLARVFIKTITVAEKPMLGSRVKTPKQLKTGRAGPGFGKNSQTNSL